MNYLCLICLRIPSIESSVYRFRKLNIVTKNYSNYRVCTRPIIPSIKAITNVGSRKLYSTYDNFHALDNVGPSTKKLNSDGEKNKDSGDAVSGEVNQGSQPLQYLDFFNTQYCFYMVKTYNMGCVDILELVRNKKLDRVRMTTPTAWLFLAHLVDFIHFYESMRPVNPESLPHNKILKSIMLKTRYYWYHLILKEESGECFLYVSRLYREKYRPTDVRIRKIRIAASNMFEFGSSLMNFLDSPDVAELEHLSWRTIENESEKYSFIIAQTACIRFIRLLHVGLDGRRGCISALSSTVPIICNHLSSFIDFDASHPLPNSKHLQNNETIKSEVIEEGLHRYRLDFIQNAHGRFLRMQCYPTPKALIPASYLPWVMIPAEKLIEVRNVFRDFTEEFDRENNSYGDTFPSNIELKEQVEESSGSSNHDNETHGNPDNISGDETASELVKTDQVQTQVFGGDIKYVGLEYSVYLLRSPLVSGLKIQEFDDSRKHGKIHLECAIVSELLDCLSDMTGFYAAITPQSLADIPDDIELKSVEIKSTDRLYHLALKKKIHGVFLYISRDISNQLPPMKQRSRQIKIPAQEIATFRDALKKIVEELKLDESDFQHRSTRHNNTRFTVLFKKVDDNVIMNILDVESKFESHVEIPENVWPQFRDIFSSACEEMENSGEIRRISAKTRRQLKANRISNSNSNEGEGKVGS